MLSSERASEVPAAYKSSQLIPSAAKASCRAAGQPRPSAKWACVCMCMCHVVCVCVCVCVCLPAWQCTACVCGKQRQHPYTLQLLTHPSHPPTVLQVVGIDAVVDNTELAR